MGLATIDPHSQKEHTEIYKIPSLVLIWLVLTETQRFKNVKISKELYSIRTLGRTASADGDKFLCKC